ncbi:MAG: hypothetical protein GF383_06510 [Candidatus Lokiarchaeota archaeon]|nr:hypothetical protein [Candidatus Lokiarchaeota archaeon]MBD3339707.1 hypothetical protein [Candidatus Lokiarchaeota archaeon]
MNEGMVEKYVTEKGQQSQIIIENTSIEIKDNATLMLAFAGVGLIGPIIANTIIDQIEDIKEIGFIVSDNLPPISVFYDGVLKHPFRIYYSANFNLILGTCEVPFQMQSAYNDLSKTICNWALDHNIKANKIISFQGIPTKKMIDEFDIYYASQHDSIEDLEQLGASKVQKGIIAGAEASIINEALTNKLEPLIFFTNVYQIATPEAAAAIIDLLNDLYSLNIDTSKLIEQGKEIKSQMLELAEKAKQYQKKQMEDKRGETPQFYQ